MLMTMGDEKMQKEKEVASLVEVINAKDKQLLQM